MKQLFNLRFATHITIAAMSFGLMACSSDEETRTEIKVPTGSQDFFFKTISFDASASEKSFTFTTNKDWTVSVADTRNGSSWCTASPSKGESGTNTVSIRVTENTTYDERNAVVTLMANDSIRKIFVSQKQLDAILLSSNRSEVSVSGGSVDVEVKSNVNYTITISDNAKSWIHQTNTATRGLSSSTISFSIDKSEEYDKREGKILFKFGSQEETVSVYQIGGGILTLTQNEYNISSSAQELPIEVNSNFDYSIELPNIDWIKEITTQTRGISTHTIKLAIAENKTYDERSAKIRVYDKNSSISEEVVINQSKKNTLIIDKKDVEFDENGGTFSVGIESNVDFKIIINCDWITETSTTTRGLASYSRSFTVAPSTNSDREGTITISDVVTGISEEIVVKQNRAIYFDNSSLTMMEGENKNINLTNKTEQEIIWNSSNISVVSIDNSGTAKANSKGNATIIATTADGLHICKCEVTVNDITDYIDVSRLGLGASGVAINGLIQQGSKIDWSFINYSSVMVHLKSMQLIDGKTGREGNIMSTETNVASNSGVAYTTTIGLLGINSPVICRFRFEYEGKEYYKDAMFSIETWGTVFF